MAATETSWHTLGSFRSPTPPIVRLVHGWLAIVSATEEDRAPFVELTVEINHHAERVDFLIDSGSDTTILMPADAERLLGERLFALDFIHGEQAVRLDGIGAYAFRILPVEASMTLEDDAQSPFAIATQLWLADPQPEGNWYEPSIFGRDAIRPGDFELSYINGSVKLIRPDNE